MRKVSVIGHFGFGKELLNGQTIKTKTVTDALERRLGEAEVMKVDTHGGNTKFLKLPFMLLRALQKSDNIIIFPAHNGLCIIAPLLVIGNMLFHRKLHYVVIGGWLSEFLDDKKILKNILKKFDNIYVETTTMKNALETRGFQNLVLMPNCKDLNILNESELCYCETEPFKLCIFSRVMREKGIEDAVEAVSYVNENLQRTAYTLDIYGQIDSEQKEWFEDLRLRLPDYITYGGMVPFDKSVETLKKYYALLFPTRFYTEGIPGTIIDAYSAGIPVISSIWESFYDIIEAGETGIGYNFAQKENLTKILLNIVSQPQLLNRMKKKCIKKAYEFTPLNVVDILISNLKNSKEEDENDVA